MTSQMLCQVDVYSFGLVIWEIFARTIPWKGLQPVQVAMKVVSEHARPPIPGLIEGTGIAALMASCWAGASTDRPSFDTVAAALEAGEWQGKPLVLFPQDSAAGSPEPPAGASF